MKGIVFTEFLEMVEQKFGMQTTDYIITKSNLKSKGVYTAVGTYDFEEMATLIQHLSEETEIHAKDLVYAYGLYFFDILIKNYQNILTYYTSAFQMIAGIEKHIHVHVRKIYPDAELPYFLTHEESADKLIIEYQSERAMYPFAHGLMERTLQYYNEDATIETKLINEDGTKVLFKLSKNI